MKRCLCVIPRARSRWRWAADRQRGFTLLEAAVAMMIIGVISAGALSAFAADLRAADQAQRLLPAAALAQDRLAVLETTSLADDVLADSLTRGRFAAPFDDYTWTASARSLLSLPGLIELKVDVSWSRGSFALTERRFEPHPLVASR